MPVIQGVTELEKNENYQFCINERVYFYIKNKHLNLPQLTTAAMWLDANTIIHSENGALINIY